jgi:hypothetical protein
MKESKKKPSSIPRSSMAAGAPLLLLAPLQTLLPSPTGVAPPSPSQIRVPLWDVRDGLLSRIWLPFEGVPLLRILRLLKPLQFLSRCRRKHWYFPLISASMPWFAGSMASGRVWLIFAPGSTPNGPRFLWVRFQSAPLRRVFSQLSLILLMKETWFPAPGRGSGAEQGCPCSRGP